MKRAPGGEGARRATCAFALLIGVYLAFAIGAGPNSANAHGPHSRVPTDSELAAGNAERGAVAFERTCSACHTIDKGARRRVGPNLFGVVGARIANMDGYPYSVAFREADIVWDDETLAAFLAAPMHVVPGTKMDWSVADAMQIADIVAFLKRYR
jgi:cytochrome c